MGKFQNFTFGNILEIARQKPDATRVAGMYPWNQLGRRVKKGEKGIRILAPMIGIRRKKDAEAEKDIRTQNQPVLVGFRSAYVFDVSQTDGAELPELSERVEGNVGEHRERLIDFVLAQGIDLDWKESISPALGVSFGGKIVLFPGQETAEEFSTLVHELAHEMLHKAERRTATTKTVRETEAEAIAFAVGKTIGLDTGRASADYIHLYHGNAALLAESLEVIQKTAAVILSALETAGTEDITEAETEHRYRCHHALMLVHSFSSTHRWFEDFAAFARSMGTPVDQPDVCSPAKVCEGVSLRLVWAIDTVRPLPTVTAAG